VPAVKDVAFRFEAETHTYRLESGRVIPHITGMLQDDGIIDDTWFTEESSERGTAVHDLTAAYDLKALELETCVSRYRGYLLGHVAAMRMLRPIWLEIERPRVHPEFLFGGRIDRVGVIFGSKTIIEIKSGAKDKSHQIQTALQAILAASIYGLPPELWSRSSEYLTATGGYKVPAHNSKSDFAEAYRLIKRYC
jgi:hypothetical protein